MAKCCPLWQPQWNYSGHVSSHLGFVLIWSLLFQSSRFRYVGYNHVSSQLCSHTQSLPIQPNPSKNGFPFHVSFNIMCEWKPNTFHKVNEFKETCLDLVSQSNNLCFCHFSFHGIGEGMQGKVEVALAHPLCKYNVYFCIFLNLLAVASSRLFLTVLRNYSDRIVKI